jgi:hypothetical protein
MPKGQRTKGKIPEMQKRFVDALLDFESPTLGNLVESMKAAGYHLDNFCKPETRAARLLCKKTVLKLAIEKMHRVQDIQSVRNLSAKERIWFELEGLLKSCKEAKDHASWAKAIDLMGKFHQLWSEKQVFSVEIVREMSAEYRKELEEIAKARLLAAPTIEAILEADKAPQVIDTQYLVDTSDNQNHNSPVTEEDINKLFPDNDLQQGSEGQ